MLVEHVEKRVIVRGAKELDRALHSLGERGYNDTIARAYGTVEVTGCATRHSSIILCTLRRISPNE